MSNLGKSTRDALVSLATEAGLLPPEGHADTTIEVNPAPRDPTASLHPVGSGPLNSGTASPAIDTADGAAPHDLAREAAEYEVEMREAQKKAGHARGDTIIMPTVPPPAD